MAKPSVNNINSSKPFGSATEIRTAIRQNKNLKSKFPNIINILLGSMKLNGENTHCADIHLSDHNAAGIPTQLFIKIKGNSISIPVKVIPGIGKAKTNAAIGTTLINQTNNSSPGTLGCFLTDPNSGTFYALSCCHVFTDDQWIDYSGFDVPAGHLIIDNTSNQQIGDWLFGLMNNSIDAAYANVTDPGIAVKSGYQQPRDINDNDILHKTPVSFKGASTPDGSGYIYNYEATRTIEYSNSSVAIDGLILISSGDNNSPSAPGDSGALVVTTGNNEPIGIIVAADTMFTYVIPINTILSNTGMNIY
jgi:hypothetical protein